MMCLQHLCAPHYRTWLRAAAAGCLLWLLTSVSWSQSAAPQLRINAPVHVGQMRSSAFDAAGQRYITSAHDRTARLWNLESQRLVAVIRPPGDASAAGEMGPVSLSPDGQDAVVTFAGRDSNLFMHRNTGAFRAALTLPGEIHSLAWSEDSRWLLVSTSKALVTEQLGTSQHVPAGQQRALQGGR